MKTADLTGPALRYAVALAEGYKFGAPRRVEWQGLVEWHFPLSKPGWDRVGNAPFRPHACNAWGNVPRFEDGLHADDIIDREKISTAFSGMTDRWYAWVYIPRAEPVEIGGATRREAAMRAWAIYNLDPEIDIPKELP